MTMRICSLASGSKGNSLFIEYRNTRVLVDAGLSGRQIADGLESINVEPDSINAIGLTHAHNDHIRGCGVFARKFNTPIFAHPDTLDSITYLLKHREKIVPWKEPFRIEELMFTPFPLSHDAYPTVGYLITGGDRKLAVCTDLGVITEQVVSHLSQAQFLVIESNHDPDMLINGPYPWDLKERIASRVGHLSNHDTAAFLKESINGRIQKIILAHLSEENNTSEIALNTVLNHTGNYLEEILDVIEQRKVSPVYEF